MPKLFITFLLMFVLPGLCAGSQSPVRDHPLPLAPSNCSNAHGWITISSPGITGNFSCFSPQISGGYASIGAGGVNGQDDVSVQMDFLSRAGIHTCRTPMVEIDLREPNKVWSTFRVRNGQFGDCTINQTYENGRKVWKGRATASLVIVNGDRKAGSPSKLHSEKDSSGNPITKTIELEWVFDQLFSLDTRPPSGKSRK